jgi:hypothetical protein
MEKTLKRSLDKKWCVRFNTRHPEKDVYDGVVIHNGTSIVVIREFRDLAAEGIIGLPKRVLSGIRDGAFELCENEILRRSGEIRSAKPIKWLDEVNTVEELLQGLSKRKIWPAIEQVKRRDPALYVGPIFHMEKDACDIYSYDAAGAWEDINRIEFKNIFKIEFHSKYLNDFNEYMRAVEKPSRPVGF